MENKDIRWQQRFSNYKKALGQLSEFVEKGDELNKLEKQGMIKAFEYTYELAWNTIKDFYEYQGETGFQGSRDAIQTAFNRKLIDDGDEWMQMLKDRNLTSHIYNEEVADDIAKDIADKYFALFESLKTKLEKHALDNK
jgi:nucleotidyltransferase substrate binding protein (TIGR01987 family)